MTANEFVLWLKGFADAANPYNITPKQWDDICSQLAKVKDQTNKGEYLISNESGMHGTTTTAERRGDTTYNNDVMSTKTLLTDNTIF